MEFPSEERWRVPFWNFVFQGKNKWMDSFRKGYSIDDTIKVKFVEFFFFFRENWTKLEFEEGQLARGWWRSNCWFWRKICERWFVMYILFLSDSYFYDIFLIKWNWYVKGECLFVDLSKEEKCKNFIFLWRDVSLIIRNLGTM